MLEIGKFYTGNCEYRDINIKLSYNNIVSIIGEPVIKQSFPSTIQNQWIFRIDNDLSRICCLYDYKKVDLSGSGDVPILWMISSNNPQDGVYLYNILNSLINKISISHKFIIEIVKDKKTNKLKAILVGDNKLVKFPKHLMTEEGIKYAINNLEWNADGNFYTVVGEPKLI